MGDPFLTMGFNTEMVSFGWFFGVPTLGNLQWTCGYSIYIYILDQRQAFTNLKCLIMVGWFPPILAMAASLWGHHMLTRSIPFFGTNPDHQIFNGNFRILKWRYLPILPYIRPYMVQYLHFRFQKWPLKICEISVPPHFLHHLASYFRDSGVPARNALLP